MLSTLASKNQHNHVKVVKNKRVNNKLEMLHLIPTRNLYIKLILWLKKFYVCLSIFVGCFWMKSLFIKLIQIFARHHPSLLRIQKLSRENSSFMYSMWCLCHMKGVDGRLSALGYSRLEVGSSGRDKKALRIRMRTLIDFIWAYKEPHEDVKRSSRSTFKWYQETLSRVGVHQSIDPILSISSMGLHTFLKHSVSYVKRQCY